MATDVYFICGQGDAATSPGVTAMAAEVKGASTHVYDWWQWAQMIADISARPAENTRLAVSYSLGANALTWVLGGVQGYAGVKVPFDYAVFIDPTTLSVITPLGGTLGEALHFHNNSLDPVGHAYLAVGPGFDKADLEVVEVAMPHLMLDIDPGTQRRVLAEINARVK
jgi:hypothetical protein